MGHSGQVNTEMGKKKDFGCEGGGKSLLDVFDFVFKYLNCRSYASPCSLLRWILFCSLTFFDETSLRSSLYRFKFKDFFSEIVLTTRCVVAGLGELERK